MNFRQIIKTLLGREDYKPRYVVENVPQPRRRTYGGKLRGIGYTRRSHEESKTRRKMAARSRMINRRKR